MTSVRPLSAICVTCNDRFKPRQRGGKPQRHCSERCRTVSKSTTKSINQTSKIKTCKRRSCKNTFSPTTAQRYCSVDCRLLDRTCPKCGKKIPLTQPGAGSTYCRPCGNTYKRERTLNPKHKASSVAAQRKITYGLGSDEFQLLVEAQNNRCAICNQPETATRRGKTRTLCVDHNHKTGAIRGLLCNRCNTALGLIDDSPITLDKAVKYLQASTKRKIIPITDSKTSEFETLNDDHKKLKSTAGQMMTCARPDCNEEFRRRTSDKYCSASCMKNDKKCFSCKKSIPINQRVEKSRLCKSCLSEKNLGNALILTANLKSYGISIADYKALYDAQRGKCAICNKSEDATSSSGVKPLAIDHSHQTGKVRGLLCTRCNTAIGLFEEDKSFLKRAGHYLMNANVGRKIPKNRNIRKCIRVGCKGNVPLTSNGQFCSDICRMKTTKDRARREHKVKKCLVCKKNFQPNSSASLYCSHLCRAKNKS